MAEPTVYLEKLSAFARILRMEGLPVSPRDTEDGAAILTQLGFADRETVKTALMTIYAKSREEQLKFSAAFDGFFLSEEAIRAQARERAEQEQQRQTQRQQAQEELEQIGDRVKLSDKERLDYRELPEEARQKLKDFLNRYKGNVDRSPQLYSEFIHSVFAKTMMEQQMLLENAGVGAEELDPELGLLCRDTGPSGIRKFPRPSRSFKPWPGRSMGSCPPSAGGRPIPASWISAGPFGGASAPAEACTVSISESPEPGSESL